MVNVFYCYCYCYYKWLGRDILVLLVYLRGVGLICYVFKVNLKMFYVFYVKLVIFLVSFVAEFRWFEVLLSRVLYL